ncbi:tRNA epoxyqueuosine(34) reductase QueG [bacterium]|nr:tRNA epoxyqueuosine(34) reductase QueG [bacterium]MBP9807017.1 tRNA epoxyqueuosine(34) reductase QueG [bacterium]
MAHLKERVLAIGHELGFDQVQIASLAPMVEEGLHYQHWLAQGYAADLAYLKRDPERRVTPGLTFPAAQSVIIVSVSYFSQPPPIPDGSWGRVARYAVGRDYHPVIRSKLRDFCGLLEAELGRKIARRPVTDDAALYEQALARRHGLGFVGKNSLVIGPKLSGSYNFIAELFVDFELEADVEYTGTCGNCVRCISACPTNAIKSGAEAEMVDANLCISYLTIENKGGIALPLRSQLGDWVYGCDICQEVCPYNTKARPAPWPEFAPESGVGHYLNLPELLHIDDQSFAQRFELSPLRRPKRRGLVRNALVVMGNQLTAGHQASKQILEEIAAFSLRENDLLLVEHAAWALAQAQSKAGQQAIDNILARNLGDSLQLEIEQYV